MTRARAEFLRDSSADYWARVAREDLLSEDRPMPPTRPVASPIVVAPETVAAFRDLFNAKRKGK